MNKTFAASLAAVTLLLAGPVAAQATDAQKQAAAEKWKQMTPEEQAAAKAKARANYESKTPEEQAAIRARAKANYQAKTPEEQAAARKRFAENHPQAGKSAASAPAQ